MLLSKEVTVELHLTGHKIKRYFASMLKQHNIPLTPEQFMLIDILWNQGEMSQQQLAAHMQKDKNSVTMLVDGLEQKGLIVRKQNAHDRRSNTMILTDKAHAMKEEAKEKGISILDTILSGIDDEELQSFLGTLRKLNRNMDIVINSEE